MESDIVGGGGWGLVMATPKFRYITDFPCLAVSRPRLFVDDIQGNISKRMWQKQKIDFKILFF